jgi:endonuclease YncB( thermonuclease family)
LAVVLLAALPAAGRERPARDPVPVAQGVVRAVVDGDTLVLESGAEVRLVGIQAPKLPLGRRGFPTWPLADEARAALAALTLNRRLALGYGGRRIDRHGRQLAHLHDGSGTWIQGEMLRRGLARVYTFADNRARAAEMYAAERAARAARRGIWADPFYKVRDVAETPQLIDSFQLVEGRVADVAVVRGRAYLNFGRDWRTDFTVTVSPRALRRFNGGRAAVEALRGQRIRVRGWLKGWNGPMIEATHPEQIERLP